MGRTFEFLLDVHMYIIQCKVCTVRGGVLPACMHSVAGPNKFGEIGLGTRCSLSGSGYGPHFKNDSTKKSKISSEIPVSYKVNGPAPKAAVKKVHVHVHVHLHLHLHVHCTFCTFSRCKKITGGPAPKSIFWKRPTASTQRVNNRESTKRATTPEFALTPPTTY